MIDQGISGTVQWILEDNGTLYFTPVFGNDGTFALSDGPVSYTHLTLPTN